MKVLLALLRDERGAAMVEYALMLALIAGAAIVGLSGIAQALSGKLINLAASLTAGQTGS
jgi:Flp pilus assembly pilin Flp